ncbi:H-2 class II histocompatibility antigen, I-E beta chain [Oryzias melastigma]|uniref:H-2 class II histocompatibility antigen, I-E beta chain n=1 Tax=Oryzias melastigma TaxID=30732 RepID=A0A834CCR5_ORYME|nr:H-2 class II histocompatibility antigen, I-E beta chain [Oryzias melastigma]
MESSSLSLCLLFLTVYSADGFINYSLDRCVFNSSDLNDIEFIRSYYYNRDEIVRFSSRVGRFVGYTEFGVKTAEYWNKDTSKLSAMRAQKETYCKHNIDIDYQTKLSKSVQPRVKVHSVTPSGGHHPSMLVCSVYDFYPKYIKVTWLRDQEEVSSDVTSTAEMEDGDWYYQIHSHLEYTPRSGEKISCKVEHASLKEPLITDWGTYLSHLSLSYLSVSHLSPPHLSILRPVHARVREEQNRHRSFRSESGFGSVSGWIHLLQEEGPRSVQFEPVLSGSVEMVPECLWFWFQVVFWFPAAEVPVLFLQTDVLNQILKWTQQNLIQNLSVPPGVLVLV